MTTNVENDFELFEWWIVETPIDPLCKIDWDKVIDDGVDSIYRRNQNE